MDEHTHPPEDAAEEPACYEPPSVTVLGTIAELTLSNQSGSNPDFSMLNSPP